MPDIEFDIPSLDEPEPPPAVLPPGMGEFDMEFDIPSLDEPVQPPPIPEAAVQKPDIDTKKVEFLQKPGVAEEEAAPVEPPEPVKIPETETGGPEDSDFDIPSLPDLEPERAGAGYGIPPVGKDGGDQVEIEYEIPGREMEQADAENVADTIVEMEAPQLLGIEQGPPIPPPGLEDDIPPARDEEAEFEYEIPAQRQAADEVDEFEIPSALEDSQDDIKVEYEIPSQEPLTVLDEADEFEIPSPREENRYEVRMAYEIPARQPISGAMDEGDEVEVPPAIEDIRDDMEVEYEMPAQPSENAAGEEIDIPLKGETDREEIEIEPGPLPSEMEYSGAQLQTETPGEEEEEGGNQQDEAEFMTESAAELYLVQGLLDDALTIYEKLYRARKEERYLVKIKQISEKRITQKKIQALTRLLNLIEKKGENRV
jgi:hypothetical protein